MEASPNEARALDEAREDEKPEVRREARQGGADREDDDPGHVQRLAPVDVG